MKYQLLTQVAVVSLALALVPEQHKAATGDANSNLDRASEAIGATDCLLAMMNDRTTTHTTLHSARDISGSLELSPSKTFSQIFKYSTTKANKKNWIGIYPIGDGPDNEKYVENSLSWEYAPDETGAVELSTANLPPGPYQAFFLANDGYKWLAHPIEFQVSNPWGSISVNTDEAALTFKYQTPHADPKNWIGIYNSFGGGPESQKFESGSLTFAYAPGESGIVTVNASVLNPGLSYRAFFLAKDGYKWLANPIDAFNPGHGPLRFITDQLTTHNARQGELFKYTITGMLDNPRDARSKFAKIDSNATTSSSSGWVTVSADGIVIGTPPTPSSNTTFVVEATGTDGSKAQIRVTVPIVQRHRPLVKELTVLSFNLWFGGTQVINYHAKQVRFISNSGADIVGLQESTGDHATRLANALGWDHWQGSDVGVISRYPIVQVYQPIDGAGAVRIALDKGYEINFWNCHLGYTPYGPYDFCYDHLTPENVLRNEIKSRRTPQIKNIMKHMQSHLQRAPSTPVIFTGDFNAPSHLDWTDATKSLHCGIGYFPWPTSKEPTSYGLIDSFREIHKDPLAEPGITWSPIYLENDGRPEPMDRIDFIYHKGLKTQNSEVVLVGNPKPQPEHKYNEWPSDHAAVRTVFKIDKSNRVHDDYNEDGDNIGRENRGNPGVLYGIVAALATVVSACGILLGCAWHRRRKSEKAAKEEDTKRWRSGGSGDTAGEES